MAGEAVVVADGGAEGLEAATEAAVRLPLAAMAYVCFFFVFLAHKCYYPWAEWFLLKGWGGGFGGVFFFINVVKFKKKKKKKKTV